MEIAQTEGRGEAAHINVDTYCGVVDSEQQIKPAERAASRVPGADKVVNALRLKPKP